MSGESLLPTLVLIASISRYTSFKAFEKRILVATDIFGRGIDVERVNVVINYVRLFIAENLADFQGRSPRRRLVPSQSRSCRSFRYKGSRYLLCRQRGRHRGPHQDSGALHRGYSRAPRDYRPSHVHDLVVWLAVKQT